MNTTNPLTLVRVVKEFKGLEHQLKGIERLEIELAKLTEYPEIMNRSKDWYKEHYAKPIIKKGSPLKVNYFSQMDDPTDFDGPGWRHCLSSSCAMIANFYNKIASDTAYRQIRKKYGDTTIQPAHVSALKELGLKAQFRTDGRLNDLYNEIDQGRPVAVGWLHKGHVTKPSGGGHWSVIIGYTDDGFIHHDPYGECLLTNGGYRTTEINSGRSILYNTKNWAPRWIPNKTDGYMITVLQ